MQKIQIFESDNMRNLRDEINEFAQIHHIEQICYAVSAHGCRDFYSCCVLYTEKENEENYLTNF